MTTGTGPDGTRPTKVAAIRSRRTFEEIRRAGHRGRSGPLSVSFLEQPCWSGPEVAFAVNRRVGNAVTRNRLKRRLRAIMSDHSAALPAGAYLVRAGPGGPLLRFDELKVAMSRALERASAGPERRKSSAASPQRGAPR